jgi:PAS domain S-box-containing protein
MDLDDIYRSCYFEDFPVNSSGLTTKAIYASPSSDPAPSNGLDTEQYSTDRLKRNQEHAKKSRLRQKFLVESLEVQVHDLQGEIEFLKDMIRKECPGKAEQLLQSMPQRQGNSIPNDPSSMSYGLSSTKALIGPDYRLIKSLFESMQTFAISDPNLPDNPIVYVSQGFLDLTGYQMNECVGRNCRFLQGPETDQSAVDVIRKGIKEGVDTSVCLLNYKADGTTFWNQFFIAPLRDAEGKIVNFVGVQYEVSREVVEKQVAELQSNWKAGIQLSALNDNATENI